MAESMRVSSLSPAPRPSAGRRVKLPHPHLAPKARQDPPPDTRQPAPYPAAAPARPELHPGPEPEPGIGLRDARAFLAPPPAAVELPAAPAAAGSRPEPGPGSGMEPHLDDWTASPIPDYARSSRSWHNPAASRAEKTLRSALWLGFCLNGAVLLLPRLAPDGRFEGWDYSGGDFLLAAAVLLSGQALLLLGAQCRHTDRQTDRRAD